MSLAAYAAARDRHSLPCAGGQPGGHHLELTAVPVLISQPCSRPLAFSSAQFPGLGGGGGGGGSKKKKNAGGSKPLDFRSKAAAPARPDGREAYKMEQAEHERWGGSQWSQ